jgi:hypothetical protein
MLVLFDNILIYNSTWAEHLQHVKIVLEQMCVNHLFIKHSKCVFSGTAMACLGHIISVEGVAMDPDMILTVESWPPPRTLHTLHKLLFLMGYYRKFIANYGKVARPLTALLKHNTFSWSSDADCVFYNLKQALIITPFVQLPDFDKSFIVLV